MSHDEQCVPVRLMPRRHTLLVLVLLAGLLGMHGLGATGALAAPGPADTGHTRQSGMAGVAAQRDCPHLDDGAGHGSHATHADDLCASAAPPQAPAMPVLLPVATGLDVPSVVPGPVADAPSGGRSPPSLAELQLLRL